MPRTRGNSKARHESWQFTSSITRISLQKITAYCYRPERPAVYRVYTNLLFGIGQGPTRSKKSMELHRIHRIFCSLKMPQVAKRFYAFRNSTQSCPNLQRRAWTLWKLSVGGIWSNLPVHLCCGIGIECSSFLDEDHFYPNHLASL